MRIQGVGDICCFLSFLLKHFLDLTFFGQQSLLTQKKFGHKNVFVLRFLSLNIFWILNFVLTPSPSCLIVLSQQLSHYKTFQKLFLLSRSFRGPIRNLKYHNQDLSCYATTQGISNYIIIQIPSHIIWELGFTSIEIY